MSGHGSGQSSSMSKIGVQGALAPSDRAVLETMLRDAEPDAEVFLLESKSLEQVAYDLTLVLFDADWKTMVANYLGVRGAIDTFANDASLLLRISRRLKNRARILWVHPREEIRAEFPQDDEQLTKAIEAARRLDLDVQLEAGEFCISMVWDPVEERWVQDEG